MNLSIDKLPAGKKIYFASDFHFGAGDKASADLRERRVVKWLDSIKADAHAIFLMGDMFDFWFEYKEVIPKGFIRFQGKLAEITDSGIPIYFFSGNHDMWMFDYFTKELGIPVFRESQKITINNKRFFLGHGDGLGPGDGFYKFLKKIFESKLSHWLFARVHPNLGVGLANAWSRKSRIGNIESDKGFLGDNEWLLTYCKEQEHIEHHDYYIFGHRHLPLDLEVTNNSRYINLGEWVNYSTYAVFDGEALKLLDFEKDG